MATEKLSISFVAELGAAVRDAAEHSDMSTSGWLAEAARAKLRADALGSFLDDWESENGALTAEELADSAKVLGIDHSAQRTPADRSEVLSAIGGLFTIGESIVVLTSNPEEVRRLIAELGLASHDAEPLSLPETVR